MKAQSLRGTLLPSAGTEGSRGNGHSTGGGAGPSWLPSGAPSLLRESGVTGQNPLPPRWASLTSLPSNLGLE